MRLASFVLLGAICATLVEVPLAQAADPTEVLIRKGVDKRRKGDNKGALPYFREAYETSRRARAAAQLGLCEQALEMWLEAEGHLAESLVSQTDAWINAQRGTLEASLQDVRQQLVRVDIEGAPGDAFVSIAGVRRGKVEDAPFFVLPVDTEILVQAGDYAFRATASGLHAGQVYKVRYEKQDASAVLPVPSKELGHEESGADVRAFAHEQPNNIANTGYTIAKWGTLGAGAIALSVGTYALFQRNSAADDFNKFQVDDAKACFLDGGKVVGPEGQMAVSNCTELDNRVGSMTTLSIVGFVGGAALLSAAIGLWVFEPKRNNLASGGVGCAPGLGQLAMYCSGSF